MNLEIFLDYYCNLNCSYCSFKSNKQSELKLNIDFSKFDSFEILGGEPLIHPQLKDILIKIPKNKPIKIYTNGKFNSISTKNLKFIEHNDIKINFVCSFHKSQISETEFLKNIIKLKNKIILIMIEDINDYDYFLNLYRKWKNMFNNVYIDGIFLIKNNKMDLSNYDFINSKNDINKTQILNQNNKYLNKNFYYIYNNIYKNKICTIKDYNRTLNCKTGKVYQCLQYMFDKDDIFSYECNKNKCCCDLGFIKELK